MIFNFSDFEAETQKIKERLRRELDGLRTGRANPALVKDILVDYYGAKAKLESLASISVSDARTLIVQPWDKQSFDAIEKAIKNSNIGLQPAAEKEVIRLILPELTGERRQFLINLVGEKLEEARVSLRKAREESWKGIQKMEKEGGFGEDEKFRLKDELQKKTDSFNDALKAMAEQKKREILS